MKRFAVVFAIFACTLGGCTPAVWMKPGGTAQQFEQDKAACMAQAEAGTGGLAPGLYSGYVTLDIAKNCLRGKGYSDAQGEKNIQTADRDRIVWVKDPGYQYKQAHTDFAECKQWNPNEDDVADCMRKKGYVGLTKGKLFDVAKKALTDGAVSKSVSSQAESDARRQKIIHIALTTQ